MLHDQTANSIPICRLCGVQCLDISYLDIFGDAERYLAFAIQKYLEIEVSDKETYSKNVCHNCSGRVEEWSVFYHKCHEVQSLFKDPPLILEESRTVSVEEPIVLQNETISNHLTKLVEEYVQDDSIVTEKIPPAAVLEEAMDATGIKPEDSTETNQDDADSVEGEDDQLSVTEDEFEEELNSESDEHSDDSNEGKKKQKPRHKKFMFNIPFLETKVGRRFTPAEKVKLQKHISKRQNTLIYEMLIGGGPGQLWECQVCQKAIKGRACEVTKHYLKMHQVQPIFPCHACDYTSRTEKMYQAHRMSHLVEYPCEHCGKVFSQHSRLVYHMNSHTNEREFECDICQKKFNTAQYVNTHKRKVHGDQEKLLKYTCELCGMRFKYKNHLQYHQKRHPTDENPLPYSCKYCEEHFMTRAEQLAHSNTVHAGEGDFVCHLCGKKMKTILSLENHVKLHSGLKEFKCEACGSAFATNHSLKCHKKIHERGPDNSLQYVCHVCQKPMSNKSSLNQHLKTHQSTKPHQCQHCSASFIHKNRLEIHMRKHTGEFPHTCVDCGKGFRSTSSMNSHRQYVHSERKFACEICQKAFKTPRDLKVHSTLHTGEKPNICPICGKAFRVRANYFKHRKIHLRANNSNQPDAQAETAGENPAEEPEDEEEEEEERGGQTEGDPGEMPVEDHTSSRSGRCGQHYRRFLPVRQRTTVDHLIVWL
ncbi:hypothetical protein DAPPUDRAFT_324651 [Daphnia pulex]|uniref:Zinc finger protein n=1 Tax=Daphnia pulex TaxID=6669 RepID=E9H2C6_DAPPU|nr:hypothetical protein DAPPUDRAFT_324651 [Daphnia pulex]|eukprot:EFX74149.1 hypothetical protein DAPPUDRAFT_324651 [Daphnia pulex]